MSKSKVQLGPRPKATAKADAVSSIQISNNSQRYPQIISMNARNNQTNQRNDQTNQEATKERINEPTNEGTNQLMNALLAHVQSSENLTKQNELDQNEFDRNKTNCIHIESEREIPAHGDNECN